MNMPLATDHTPAWLARFRVEPKAALDAMLRGLARVPPYERAAPPDILDRLFGGLPADDPDLCLLDETLRDWLAARRMDMDPERHAEYGLSRFVTETMGALSTIWLLDLPRSGAWIQDNFLELTRRVGPLRLSEAWDLPRALTQAAALTQTDQRLRFYWLRLCKDAARPSLRDMIDPALSGLSNLPDAKGHGASPELIAGLARFGAGLASTPRDQRDFLRRWRALKARFPRTGKTWRGLWQAPLTNRQYRDQPFIDWLKESEPALRGKWTGKPPAPPTKQQLDGLFQRLRRGERATLLPEIQRVLDGYEHHAEATGDDYFFVRSACNLGKAVLPWAPGYALAWARDALRWSPNDSHAWDLRGSALNRLGHPDIAQAVYWEAVRRLPDNAVVRNQLARLLVDQGRESEAENLFREAHTRDPDDAVAPNELARLLAHTGREAEAEVLFRETYARDPGDAVARVELARLLARTGRQGEAEALLRRTFQDLPDDPIAPYLLAQYLIAWGRPEEAAAVHTHYVQTFGEDERSTVLRRLLDAGAESVAEVRQQLADHDPYAEPDMESVASDAKATECQAVREAGDWGALPPEPGMYPVRSDAEIAEYEAVREKEAHDALYPEPGTQSVESDAETTNRAAALEGEKRGAPFLRRAAGAGRADLLFRIRDAATAEQTLAELLADDPGDLYPQVVWALHVPGRRTALAGHYREALGALAPHLAAAGPETPTSHWEHLYEAFPERRRLIDFTRLMRSGYEEAVATRLGDWIAGEEDDADAFLRACLKKTVAEDGCIDPAAPGLEDLLNAGILAAVDLGDGILGQAA
ncbi:tetratricopeptide repeat protein [Candidatus Thiosymbion oneisti]|uniref:tetratricopeptide repeat protein n=1 Tax=Candidatus Thiosymbion oneisti TaxID=589554 RepID=UPI0013FD9581|nr:tetratricopeptide repeat protein [Candidatus Thiosymbion oneisti]